MCTLDERRLLRDAYRKYEKGRFVEPEDVWAVEYLELARVLKLSIKDKKPYAIDFYREARRFHGIQPRGHWLGSEHQPRDHVGPPHFLSSERIA